MFDTCLLLKEIDFSTLNTKKTIEKNNFLKYN